MQIFTQFFKHKYRVVWSKIENVENINQIKHKVVKNLLKFHKINRGVEIHYDGDLPARSGMGSSSCFTVGLMKALNTLHGKKKYLIISLQQMLYILSRKL